MAFLQDFLVAAKDYQTLLSALAVVVAGLIAWTATFIAAWLTSRSAHKLEKRKTDAMELEVDRKRLAFTSAIQLAAFATKNEAKFRKQAYATLARRALQMPYPEIFNAAWDALGLLSYQQQIDLFMLRNLIAKFNTIIADESIADLNHAMVSDLYQNLEDMARHLEDSARHRAKQILAVPAMRRDAKRHQEDVKRGLLAPLNDLEDRLRSLDFSRNALHNP
jgi:hypothetical protein